MKVGIKNGFDIGCHKYVVESDSKQTLARNRYGECDFVNSIVRFAPIYSEDKLHEAICHEFIEAINITYCADRIEHEEIVTLANGLAQLTKSIGVIFTLEEQDINDNLY